jgi:hypothetical protein
MTVVRTAVYLTILISQLAWNSAAAAADGAIRGTVQDQGGGVLPGAAITVTNPEHLSLDVARTSQNAYGVIHRSKGLIRSRFRCLHQGERHQRHHLNIGHCRVSSKDELFAHGAELLRTRLTEAAGQKPAGKAPHVAVVPPRPTSSVTDASTPMPS